MAQITVRTNGQTLTVNASVSHWTTAALAVTASAGDDVESTTTTTITSDYTMHFANTATTATVTVKQLDGTTLHTGTYEVNPGVGARVLSPTISTDQASADVSTLIVDHPRYMATGEAIVPRIASILETTGPGTGVLHLTYFPALKSETCTSAAMIVGAVAAAATPTLVRMGLYSIDSAGAATLIASTANDTALFSAANTRYSKDFTTPVARTAGQRYALGVLTVSAGACANFLAITLGAGTTMNVEAGKSPMLATRITSQTDLPSTITAAAQVAAATRIMNYATIA